MDGRSVHTVAARADLLDESQRCGFCFYELDPFLSIQYSATATTRHYDGWGISLLKKGTWQTGGEVMGVGWRRIRHSLVAWFDFLV